MTAPAISESDRTYKNPVYPRSFPDPFVLKHGRDYFAYCTGVHDDGRVFQTLHSNDLVHWTELGGAMRRLDVDAPFYWAPEVTFHAGRYYLYYSVGNETLMEIRLAVSERPDGGFEDAGTRLTFEDFAIDPHVFIDGDGQPYLFYATDFLEHSHIGTGTVVDRMLDWDKLEGRPRPVTRAKYDWQVYDPARKEKGGVRWHTVEGPFVLKRKGRYFEMFSGGNWQNTSYGVSFAVSDHLLTADEWQQFSDGEQTLPILRTTPDIIVGPGHNSVVRGPNGRDLYCVYHRWTEAGRVMAIDRMDFAGDRIFVAGPTNDVQPAPYHPDIVEATQGGSRDGVPFSRVSLPPASLCEFVVSNGHDGPAGFELYAGGQRVFDYFLEREDVGIAEPLSAPTAVLSVDINERRLRLSRDGVPQGRFSGMLVQVPDELRIYGLEGTSVAVTEGFEELFDQDIDPSENGWRPSGTVRVENGVMLIQSPKGESAAVRRCFSDGFELAVNLRVEMPSTGARFGIRIESSTGSSFHVGYSDGKVTYDPDSNGFPSELSAFAVTRQIRISALKGRTMVYLDGSLLGTTDGIVNAEAFRIYCKGTDLALDMVRLTRI